jgi:hypothetical protein
MKRFDHIAEARDNRPPLLTGERWGQLMLALAKSRQKLEDTIIALHLQRSILVAVGKQLDAIGALVGQARDTTDDVLYQRRIFAKIGLNRSAGLHEDLLRLVKLILFDVSPRARIESAGATATITAEGVAISDALAREMAAFAQRAASAGVRVLLESTTADDDDAFTLGWIPEQVDGSYGIGSTSLSVITPGDGFAGWPASGLLEINGDGIKRVYSKTGDPLTIAFGPPLTVDLIGGEAIAPITSGKGLGDSTEPGHPTLVRYTSPGTTGGQLSDVR